MRQTQASALSNDTIACNYAVLCCAVDVYRWVRCCTRTQYYSNVLEVGPSVSTFHMHRVTIRAAGFFGLQCNIDNQDQVFIKEHGGRPAGQMCASRGRYANFSGTGGTSRWYQRTLLAPVSAADMYSVHPLGCYQRLIR